MYRRIITLLRMIGFVSVVLLFGCVSGNRYTQSPVTPDLSGVQWRTIANATFDETTKDRTRFRWRFPGMSWSITNGVAMVSGVSEANKWSGTRVTLPVEGDTSELLEVSGEFKLVEYEGYHLVALFAHKQAGGSLCMFFEGRDGAGYYRIQSRWMKQSSELLNGTSRISGTGTETQQFNKMKMIVDRTRSCILYYVNDQLMGTVKIDEPVSPITAIEMDFESPEAGNASTVLYDNLTARSGASP